MYCPSQEQQTKISDERGGSVSATDVCVPPPYKRTKRGCRAGRKKQFQNIKDGKSGGQSNGINSLSNNSSTSGIIIISSSNAHKMKKSKEKSLPVSSHADISVTSANNNNNNNNSNKHKKSSGKQLASVALPLAPPPVSINKNTDSNNNNDNIPSSQPFEKQKISSTSTSTNYLQMACTAESVAQFAQAFCRYIFPRIGVWSSSSQSSSRLNFNLFMKRIKEFVCLGRWESLSVRHLAQRMRTSALPWLEAGVRASNEEVLVLLNVILYCI